MLQQCLKRIEALLYTKQDAKGMNIGRKVFMTLCAVLFLFSCSKREDVGIKKVEHFYNSSNNASSIFQLLFEQFAPPVVWGYQDGFKNKNY